VHRDIGPIDHRLFNTTPEDLKLTVVLAFQGGKGLFPTILLSDILYS